MLELNGEFHPQEVAIPRELAALYERLGRTPAAVTAYRRLLELSPGDARAQARLQALGGG